MSGGPLLIALDSGTSMVKAVAFTAGGERIDIASRPNRVELGPGGAAEQDMGRIWESAAAVLAELMGRLASRPGGVKVAALAVTGQGDGIWLVDRNDEPVAPAWLWLDSRAGGIAEHLRDNGAGQAAFAYTGTGITACAQSAQLLCMGQHHPGLLARAAAAMHCKDWLYLKLTGVCATDPSEAAFTFGDYRTRGYREEVLQALDLVDLRWLLPPIVDGTRQTHPLSARAAARTGLPAGLPVALGYVDMVCTALGAGIYGPETHAGVSILGSTGLHIRLVEDPSHVAASPAMTGYCMPFPVPGYTVQAQSNMAATLNMDWLADVVAQAARLAGVNAEPARGDVLRRLDDAAAAGRPGAILYHPFISSAGERGPFTDSFARASLIGLDQDTGLPELARGVYEGMALAARDCYAALGGAPAEVRITGGAARSAPMRAILASCLDRPVSGGAQAEAGAAGAAMTAAVCIGLYPDMAACAARWTAPRHEASEQPDPDLARAYEALYPIYRDSYAAMPGLWRRLEAAREARRAA
jgi:erythritol kinase